MQECFQRLPITPEEELQCKVFTYGQRVVLINQIQALAIEIVNLTYDHKDKEGYALRLAEKQGQISMLQYLLHTSDDALRTLNQQAVQGDMRPPEQAF